MNAIKIIFDGATFLLPDSHQFYEFPSYIEKHREAINLHIEAGKKFSNDPMSDHFSALPDLTEFKRITGIIGYPLDAYDPELYALDRNIDIIMEVNFT